MQKEVVKVRRTLAGIAALGVIAALTACPPAEISLDVTPMMTVHYIKPGKDILTVDAGLPIELEYTWEVGDAYEPPPVEMRAFVHFRGIDGEMILQADGTTLQDDHNITPPPSEWKPGMSVLGQEREKGYIGVIFPEAPDGESYLVMVEMGLYNPDDGRRAALKWPGEQIENRAYPVMRFNVRSDRKECIVPTFESSWHGPEPGTENVRWSAKESVVSFRRYPRAEAAELYFSGHSPCMDIEEPHVQKLWIYAHEVRDDLLVGEFEFTDEQAELTSVFVPAKLYSNEEFFGPRINFVFVVDRLLKTGEEDPRGELGFMVYKLWLAPRDARQ